ncbi:MAG: transcription elongation factor GreA [Oscillospiraceae bacterium]
MKLAKEILLTQAGFDDLIKELEFLKTEKRLELAEKIKIARGFGDLSENSEYDEAKNEQGLVEQRVLELEAIIKNAKIVTKDNIIKNTVGVGTHVIVEDEDGDDMEYAIVGATEFDPMRGKISEDSPIGIALKGHKTGETVVVSLPTGASMTLKIKKVTVKER